MRIGSVVGLERHAQVAHDPPPGVVDHFLPGLQRDFAAEVREGVGLADEPAELLGRGRLQGIAQHRQAEVESRFVVKDVLVGVRSQILAQHRLQIFDADPAPQQSLAVALLRQVGLTAEQAGAVLHAFVEGKMFERLQRIDATNTVIGP